MGRHAESRRNRAGNDAGGTKFTHASYTGGRTVMCAGEFGIAHGKVVKVTNSSGHYKPTPEKLVGVLDLLKVAGTDLSQVLVEATSVQGNVTCWAQIAIWAGHTTPFGTRRLRVTRRFRGTHC